MFWKAIVLSLYSVAAERYAAIKAKRGTVLLKGRDGIYRDPFLVWERRAKNVGIVLAVIFALYLGVVVSYFIG